ncbi:translation initiation factor IF-3 [Stappia sp.]|uniref:translation initiation factor IF-3 n=1 Tax=Stappia sp. TaxID=1870903 RepID=UPI003D0CF8B9
MDERPRMVVDGGRLLGQAIRVVLALVVAFLSAAFFLAFGFLRAIEPGADPVAFGMTVGWSLVGASIIGGFAFTPALVAIAISEGFGLRGMVFHILAGGLIGAGTWFLTEAAGSAGVAQGLPAGTLVVLAAGFVAGFVYWLLAGRQAGCWRVPRQDGPGSAA